MKVNQDVKDIISSLYSMTDSEVRMINNAAYNILNNKRKRDLADKKSTLNVGMRVKFRGKGGYPETGTITKVNRTRCVVDTGGFRQWTVPISMLSPV